MARTRIKICGITNAADARLAVDAGADAIGVIFAPSKRQLNRTQAALALAHVPPAVARIGVFVDPTLADVLAAVRECGLTAVQLSGHESPEMCSAVGVASLKTLHVGTDFDSRLAEPFLGHASALLLDTYVAGKAGGTSQAFDWQTAGMLPGWALFVAGGLNPHNVGECVRAARPYAVDVSSGVERAPGIKDPKKIIAFCEAVRRADQESTDE
jgi:phosphoribosylanthranilate isomerase